MADKSAGGRGRGHDRLQAVPPRAGETVPGAEPETTRPICSVAFCPICTAVGALGEGRAEVLEHLLLAGREMLLAIRAVMDTRVEAPKPPRKLERIDIG